MLYLIKGSEKATIIPVLLTWAGDHGEKDVFVTGSFNDWKKKIRLNKRYTYFHMEENYKAMLTFLLSLTFPLVPMSLNLSLVCIMLM